MSTDKKFLCNNTIVSSIKKHTPVQLKMLYAFIREYGHETGFRGYEDGDICINKSRLKDILKGYESRDRVIEVLRQTPKDIEVFKNNEFVSVSIFETIKYDFNTNDIEFEFTNAIREYLDDITMFTELNLEEIARLKNKHSLRMYELACQYKNQGCYNMSLKMFRAFFGVNDKYKMCEIDRAILGRGIEELHTKTNKRITVEKIKKSTRGSEVTHIKLYFN